MTIDEAIEHATQIADSYKDTVPDCDYVRDQRQLADWLRKARGAKKAARWYTSKIRELESENDKLRAERDEWHRVAVSKQDIIDHMRDARTENTKLRKRIAELEELLPDSGRWFSAETVDAYVAENAKLMKIVSCLLTCASDTGDCDRCPLNGGTGDWDSRDFCDGLLDSLRELRFEVTP